MTHTFTRSFRVRAYECDLLGHVNNAVYQHYCEQAAIEASEDAGYGMEWYETQEAAWVIRRITVEYLRPALSGQVLGVTTWISSQGRVRAQREYEIRRPADGELIARASATWIYVDRASGQPRRIPGELAPAFGPPGRAALQPAALPERGLEAGSFLWRHQVKRYELDGMQHVNNAVYLHWVEEAKFRAAESAGWSLERLRAHDLVTVQIRHDTEYLLPAVYGDEIEIVSRVHELRKVRGTWLHEVYCADGRELLARNYSTGAFLNVQGRP
ncbi:MAG TPA: thioesterase family protein, partial [Ardenticatenaceae bacterium]|nr:thioesterase family protein [Ardenticatenaceae bacterium]